MEHRVDKLDPSSSFKSTLVFVPDKEIRITKKCPTSHFYKGFHCIEMVGTDHTFVHM